MFLVDIGLANLDGVADERVRVDLLKIQLHLAFADARQIEQIVDQTCFQLDVAPDHLKRRAKLVRQTIGRFEGVD